MIQVDTVMTAIELEAKLKDKIRTIAFSYKEKAELMEIASSVSVAEEQTCEEN